MKAIFALFLSAFSACSPPVEHPQGSVNPAAIAAPRHSVPMLSRAWEHHWVKPSKKSAQ